MIDDGPPTPPIESYDDGPHQAREDGPDSTSRPTIRLGARVDIVEEDAVRALAAMDVYVRSGRLVRVVDDQIRDITAHALIPILSAAADWSRAGRNPDGSPTRIACSPPKQIAQSLHDLEVYPGIRDLDGVTRVPVVRADGSVCATPGYHAPSRLVYSPEGRPPTIVEHPTERDAREAVDALLDPVAEFDFLAEADRSAWLALLLTLVGRSAIRGPAPMFLSTANQARVGKTSIIQLAGLIAHGEATATTDWPVEAAELAKKVDSFIFAGRDIVLWDNIRGAIGGSSLEAVLTTTRHEARILGVSEVRTAPARTVWCASGNGATLKGDMAGRTLPIRLYHDQPHPERRTFEIPNIVEWVTERRLSLLSHAITVLRAFLLERPTVELAPWGSYESWSRTIRGAIVWLGLPDPIETRATIEQIDGGANAHDRLVLLAEALFGHAPWSCGGLAERVDAPGTLPGSTLAQGWTLGDARDVLAQLGAWDRTAKAVDRTRLGMRISENLDRPTPSGHSIRHDRNAAGQVRMTRSHAAYYCVVGPVTPAP